MILMLKRSLYVIFFALVVLGLGFLLINQTKSLSTTPEETYERTINEKVTTLLNILIEPHSFYVNTTVYLRQKEERIYNYEKTPRSVLYERETVNTTIETSSNETPVVEESNEALNLPGFSNVLNETKQYELTNETLEERVSLQERNKSNKETIEEIYYDETKSETILPKHGIEELHV